MWTAEMNLNSNNRLVSGTNFIHSWVLHKFVQLANLILVEYIKIRVSMHLTIELVFGLGRWIDREM